MCEHVKCTGESPFSIGSPHESVRVMNSGGERGQWFLMQMRPWPVVSTTPHIPASRNWPPARLAQLLLFRHAAGRTVAPLPPNNPLSSFSFPTENFCRENLSFTVIWTLPTRRISHPLWNATRNTPWTLRAYTTLIGDEW